MITVAVSERDHSAAVEIDAIPVRQVRVLAGVHPARGERDLALFLVHLLDVADHPRALRDLGFHAPGRAVVQVKMVPAVALGGPDDLLPVGNVDPALLLAVVDEGGALFGDQRARLAGLGGDLDHTEDLVPALVVLEREAAAVLPPERPR